MHTLSFIGCLPSPNSTNLYVRFTRSAIPSARSRLVDLPPRWNPRPPTAQLRGGSRNTKTSRANKAPIVTRLTSATISHAPPSEKGRMTPSYQHITGWEG